MPGTWMSPLDNPNILETCLPVSNFLQTRVSFQKYHCSLVVDLPQILHYLFFVDLIVWILTQHLVSLWCRPTFCFHLSLSRPLWIYNILQHACIVPQMPAILPKCFAFSFIVKIYYSIKHRICPLIITEILAKTSPKFYSTKPFRSLWLGVVLSSFDFSEHCVSTS